MQDQEKALSGSLRLKFRTKGAVDESRQLMARLNVAIQWINLKQLPLEFVATSESLENDIRSFSLEIQQKVTGISSLQQFEYLLNPLKKFQISNSAKVEFFETEFRPWLKAHWIKDMARLTKQNVKLQAILFRIF
jgi:hypothetical protein